MSKETRVEFPQDTTPSTFIRLENAKVGTYVFLLGTDHDGGYIVRPGGLLESVGRVPDNLKTMDKLKTDIGQEVAEIQSALESMRFAPPESMGLYWRRISEAANFIQGALLLSRKDHE
jgi:hypothetical protein